MVVLSTLSPNMSFTQFTHKLHEETREVEYEIDKICELYVMGVSPYEVKENYTDALLSEVFDVIQTCFTFMQSNFIQDEILLANKKHLKKMETRYAKN